MSGITVDIDIYCYECGLPIKCLVLEQRLSCNGKIAISVPICPACEDKIGGEGFSEGYNKRIEEESLLGWGG